MYLDERPIGVGLTKTDPRRPYRLGSTLRTLDSLRVVLDVVRVVELEHVGRAGG